ncbi:MarR family winged helix-turn-helix transcriptional regulator [Motilibacter aurantiacus]|uniref:MarR family winged helix-turn-helix transcriptional regulator n=1 Tax=Motilibacter aurantiacus TaxID=2714955 RepID=UPI0014078426|nr:MarR family transcriptional regulator [Motilibacter aurantiacus]
MAESRRPRRPDDLFADPRWEAFGLLREAYLALSGRIDGDLAAAGAASSAISDLVFRLARTPGHALRALDITRALHTSTTRTTRLLDEAEAGGLVERRPHPSDRRALLVVLTPAGLAEARRLGRVALDSTQRHVHDRLSAEEVAQLEGLLRRLRDG